MAGRSTGDSSPLGVSLAFDRVNLKVSCGGRAVHASASPTMEMLKGGLTAALMIIVVVRPLPANAQAPASANEGGKPTAADGAEIIEAVEDPGVRKEFSPGEVKVICGKYEGKLIAYYSDVYMVQRCARRAIANSKTVYGLTRQGQRILSVDGDTVAALPEGEPYDQALGEAVVHGCGDLEGKYISYSAVDVYFVEKCKKRLFPDWTTYLEHRARRGNSRGEIMSLNWGDFDGLPLGEPVPSVVDQMFAKMLSGEAGIDVIPIDEACAGVEGKIAAFYSRLYRIERCHKREIGNPAAFLRQREWTNAKIVELKAEQWLSLPDGPPVLPPPSTPR